MLVLVAAVVVGVTRNLTEGSVFRGLADTTKGDGLLRAHAIRTTVNQAALFGTAFVGLLLFHFGGASAVLVGICVLYLVALAILAIVPPNWATRRIPRRSCGIAWPGGSRR